MGAATSLSQSLAQSLSLDGMSTPRPGVTPGHGDEMGDDDAVLRRRSSVPAPPVPVPASAHAAGAGAGAGAAVWSQVGTPTSDVAVMCTPAMPVLAASGRHPLSVKLAVQLAADISEVLFLDFHCDW